MTFLTLFGSNPDKASNRLQPTAYSVRSYVAPAFCSSKQSICLSGTAREFELESLSVRLAKL